MRRHWPVAAIEAQLERGATFMLPTADAAAAAALLADRFGLPDWQFTVSATDANRSIIRYARQVTGRRKVLVHDHSYHGTVDEAYATLGPEGSVVSRRGNIGPPVDLAETTAVVPFNDVPALEAALAGGDIAVVLIEPALTNIGIVLPELPGTWRRSASSAREHGAILVHRRDSHAQRRSGRDDCASSVCTRTPWWWARRSAAASRRVPGE